VHAADGTGEQKHSVSFEATIDVLLVEDDDDVRASFAAVLQDAGYATGEAADCPAALEELERSTIHCVLLDIYLPGLNGFWLLDQLDRLPPVVLLTGHDYDQEVLVRRDKVFAFVQKPVAPPALLPIIARSVAAGKKAVGIAVVQ
jgi:CheY-like chemotaxis protein